MARVKSHQNTGQTELCAGVAIPAAPAVERGPNSPYKAEFHAKTVPRVARLDHRCILARQELCPKVDGAVKSRFILGAGPSIFGHDYIARQKDR